MPDLPDLANLDYVDRVNRAIDHVTRNLSEPLLLDDVAQVACFSPYHFHRIFRALTGETLAAFTRRVRLERALYLLSHTPRTSLTDIALRCGFGSSSNFSRTFRAVYGVAPRRFDLARHRDEGRAALQAAVPGPAGASLARLPPGHNPDGFDVTLRALPARRVAYVRVMRAYGHGVLDAIDRLRAWARPRGLEGGQWLGYQWDDPELVPIERCRYDAGLELPPGFDGGGESNEVSITNFPAMTVAALDVRSPIDLELRALDWLFATWLPRSGHAPTHQPCFEAWHGAPFAHGTSHFELTLQLPVEVIGRPARDPPW